MNKRIINNIFVRYFVIPLFLIGVWLSGSLYILLQTSVSSISYSEASSIYADATELTAGKKIVGGLEARENNLGAIKVRFDTKYQSLDDVVKFRIKLQGNKDWFYSAEHKTDQFQHDQMFPFGFEPQPTSAGKKYYFEIESKYGVEGYSIMLSDRYPNLISEYQFSKESILNNSQDFGSFFLKKLNSLLYDFKFLFYSFLLLLPLLFYVLWLFYPILYRIPKKQDLLHKSSQSPSNYFRNLPFFIISLSIYYIAVFLIKINVIPFSKQSGEQEQLKVNSVASGNYIRNFPFVIFFLFISYSSIFFITANTILPFLPIIILWVFIARIYRFSGNTTFLMAALVLIICPFLVYFRFNSAGESAGLLIYMLMVTAVIQLTIQLMRSKKKFDG